MSSPYLLITPRLDAPFAESLALHLRDKCKSTLFVIVAPLPNGTQIPTSLNEEIAQKRLQIAFGSTANKRLVREIVDEHQIRAIFLLPSVEPISAEHSPSGLAARAQSHLTGLCSLLEAIRQCAVTPSLIPVFGAVEPIEMLQVDGVNPLLQCKTEQQTHFSAAFALFHAFAVSYRLNIQIALCNGVADASTMQFISGLTENNGGRSPINVHKAEGAMIEKKSIIQSNPMVRMLIFGSSSEAVLAAIEDGEPALRGASELIVAQTKPGLDADEAVEKELIGARASHVAFVHAIDEAASAQWETGGAAQLLPNVRHHVFAPWLLAQICERFGLQFVVPIGDEQVEPAPQSRCGVARHFGERTRNLRANGRGN